MVFNLYKKNQLYYMYAYVYDTKKKWHSAYMIHISQKQKYNITNLIVNYFYLESKLSK